MSGRKKTGKEVSIVRSSAPEYLTFVAASGTGGIDAVYADENIWLTQKMMGLTTWKYAPGGKIQKFDVVVSKNYLSEHEMAQLARLVSYTVIVSCIYHIIH
jgi:hypothetical protein